MKNDSKFLQVDTLFSFHIYNDLSLDIDAVRYKFKLDSVNFGLFYRKLLRRKLTDFLIEERRRESIKAARQSIKQAEAHQKVHSNFDEILG